MQTINHQGIKVTYDEAIPLDIVKNLTEAEKADWWENLDHMALGYLTITREGNEIVLHGKEAPPIERIRRITGYLTGTVGRWCNAKKAELNDRVKHA